MEGVNIRNTNSKSKRECVNHYQLTDEGKSYLNPVPNNQVESFILADGTKNMHKHSFFIKKNEDRSREKG